MRFIGLTKNMLLNMNYKYYNIPMPYDSKLLLLLHRTSVSYKETDIFTSQKAFL